MRPSVFVAIPNLGAVCTDLAVRLMEWVTAPALTVKVFLPQNVQPHHRARNLCHREFIASGMDHLLFVDADTVPPPGALERFLAHRVPIVSGVVLTWKDGGVCPVAFRWDNERKGYRPHYGTGLETVDVGTLAFCLIERPVMEALPPSAFVFQETDEWGTDGYGEDFVFFRKVAELGFQARVDYGVLCGHYKTLDLMDVNRACLAAESAGAKRCHI